MGYVPLHLTSDIADPPAVYRNCPSQALETSQRAATPATYRGAFRAAEGQDRGQSAGLRRRTDVVICHDEMELWLALYGVA